MKININNTAKIESSLARVNGKATSFTVTSAQDLHDVCGEATNTLASHALPKNLWYGTMVTYRPNGPHAKSYRYGSISTTVTMQLGHNGQWFLTDAVKSIVLPKQSRQFEITVSQAALDALVAGVTQKFRVHKVLPSCEPAPAPEPDGVPSDLTVDTGPEYNQDEAEGKTEQCA